MATAPLVPAQIEATFQAITLSLGLQLSYAPPGSIGADPPPSQNYYGVRIGWEQEGQPFQQITEDIAYLRCYEVDDQYNRVRDLIYSTNLPYTETWKFTRVWETYWSIYGPNSFDNARIIRSSMWLQSVHDMFASANLYWVTDAGAPVRAPELMDGQWWPRTDFHARFNELVTETNAQNSVVSAEVLLYDEFGNQFADITVEDE
jgi:hypothetical protein